jgi:hypothetical protein
LHVHGINTERADLPTKNHVGKKAKANQQLSAQ